MTRTRNTVTEQPVEAPIEATQAPVAEVIEEVKQISTKDISEAKKAFMAKVEAYKISNPSKYAHKEASFKATLDGMI